MNRFLKGKVFILNHNQLFMEPVTLLGLIAGIFTTFGIFPQLIKSWRTKSTKDVSLLMYVIVIFGVVLWLTYGFFRGDLPIIFWNVLGFIFISLMIIMKLVYG